MKKYVSFQHPDAGEFLRVRIKCKLKLNDLVYFELNDKQRKDLINYYPHLECEGNVNDVWINLSGKEIIYNVDIDFEEIIS